MQPALSIQMPSDISTLQEALCTLCSAGSMTESNFGH